MTDKALARVAKLGYLVQNAFQASPTHWEVTLRSSADWYNRLGRGATLAEALDAAATVVIDHKVVKARLSIAKGVLRRPKPPTKPKRVKLEPKVRVKLPPPPPPPKSSKKINKFFRQG